MSSSRAFRHLMSLFGLAATGCGMTYLQHGYYESWGLPGWAYSLDHAQCTFLPKSRPDVPFVIALAGEEGHVAFLGTVDLPKGEAFSYEGASAWLTTAGGRRRAIPIRALLQSPEWHPRNAECTYTDRSIAPGETASGTTLQRPKALVFRAMAARVEVRGGFDLAEGEDFTLELPPIHYGAQTLPAFKARFHWNQGAIHLLKHVQ